mgnify:CR=1 FL=1
MIRCNICDVEFDEKDVDTHVKSIQHEEKKAKISSNASGLEISVVKTWRNSLNN